ncbi:cyclic lactone autoinducer peptide [Schinkia azotoformans]|nr:cyclic lactone autoinducer peptide [Schinkia azotoformans]MEC1640137.1 cyclic lactone autoinducer peptide [Schinkia azotoformans]MEC1945556.1 cyclic lactone autoinducer peptide [Schinkia azotoformans]MED4354946.1 cyclic lactone autoinducer peptide [Schinkia azotoformans]
MLKKGLTFIAVAMLTFVKGEVSTQSAIFFYQPKKPSRKKLD